MYVIYVIYDMRAQVVYVCMLVTVVCMHVLLCTYVRHACNVKACTYVCMCAMYVCMVCVYVSKYVGMLCVYVVMYVLYVMCVSYVCMKLWFVT